MSTIKVKKTCPECEAVHFVTVPKEGHARWKAGELLQNAMPELSADDRETLLTGICPPCWDRLFPEECCSDCDGSEDYEELFASRGEPFEGDGHGVCL